ncbi:MAG: hypothetical protein J0H49_33365 [Acidobacteria bacterium]|nr:hypothetical protein [Acidobacteriota bacterium]
MQSDAAFYLMAGAVSISSIALLMNALASLGIYRAVRKLQQDVSPLIPEAKETLAQAQKVMTEATRDVKEITTQARDIMQAIDSQLTHLDNARQELSTHLRIQGERVELVVEDVLMRVQDVVSVVHGGVLRPVREVSGVVAGVKAAVQTFLLGRRPTVDRATHDEEMFI